MFSSAMEAGISGKRIKAFLLMPQVDVGLIQYHPEGYPKEELSVEGEFDDINEDEVKYEVEKAPEGVEETEEQEKQRNERN